MRSGGNALPNVNADWYARRPLGFEPEAVRAEFSRLKMDVESSLGNEHPAGAILLRMFREYSLTVRMLENRGKPDFGKISRELCGSTEDSPHPDEPPLGELGRKIEEALDRIDAFAMAEDPDDVDDIPGVETAVILHLAKMLRIPSSLNQ